jgi:hypothetical protein
MTDIIELTAEEKLQMNDVVGELHIQLENLRNMIMKPFDTMDVKIGTLAEIIKEDLDRRIVTKMIDIGYERHLEKNAVSENKFDRKSRRTRKRHNSL